MKPSRTSSTTARHRLVGLRLRGIPPKHRVQLEFPRVEERLAEQQGGAVRMLLEALFELVIADGEADLDILGDGRTHADCHAYPRAGRRDLAAPCLRPALRPRANRGHFVQESQCLPALAVIPTVACG